MRLAILSRSPRASSCAQLPELLRPPPASPPAACRTSKETRWPTGKQHTSTYDLRSQLSKETRGTSSAASTKSARSPPWRERDLLPWATHLPDVAPEVLGHELVHDHEVLLPVLSLRMDAGCSFSSPAAALHHGWDSARTALPTLLPWPSPPMPEASDAGLHEERGQRCRPPRGRRPRGRRPLIAGGAGLRGAEQKMRKRAEDKKGEMRVRRVGPMCK